MFFKKTSSLLNAQNERLINMKYLLSILIVLIGLSFSIPYDRNFNIFRGQILDTITHEGLPFLGVKAFVNDTLWGFGVSDLEGKFTVTCPLVVDSFDKVVLEFHGPSGIFEERNIDPVDKSIIKVKHTVHDSITTKISYKWRGELRASIPNYLDCHPQEPLDDFVIKQKTNNK